jgi:hypothetical protein
VSRIPLVSLAALLMLLAASTIAASVRFETL